MESCSVLDLLAVCLLVPGLVWSREEWQERQERQLGDQISSDMMNIKMLSISVPGQPGQDYPILACADKIRGRSYADIDAFCQVYHTCSAGENLNNIQFSRLCPNGTIFDQRGQTCRWWYLVDCQQSEAFYNFVEEEFPGDSDTGVSNPFASAAEETTTEEPDDGRVSVGTVFFAVPANQVPDEILNVGERVNVTGLVNLNQITGNGRPSFNNRNSNDRRNQFRNNNRGNSRGSNRGNTRGNTRGNNRGNNRGSQQRTNVRGSPARGQTVIRGIVPRDDPGVSTIRPVPPSLRNRNTITNTNSQKQLDYDYGDYDLSNSVFSSQSQRQVLRGESGGPVRVRYT